MDAYRACLQQHGVTLPAGGFGGGGFGRNGGNGGNGGDGGNGTTASSTAPPSEGSSTDTSAPRTRPSIDDATRAALQACASLRPQGQGGGPGANGAGNPNGPNGANSSAFQAYIACLKDNGVNVPTTTAGQTRPSIDQNDPAYQAANAKCRVLLPARQGGSTTTSTAPAAATPST